MHDAASAYIDTALPKKRHGLAVLEFGSRNINGSVRDIVGDCARYVGVDLIAGPGVDVVADAGTVKMKGGFDVVACAEVFEHATDKQCVAMVANAHSLLTAGGLFVATMAGPGRLPHSAVDGGLMRDGEFYRNIDAGLLAGWLSGAGFTFDIDEAGPDLRCTATK